MPESSTYPATHTLHDAAFTLTLVLGATHALQTRSLLGPRPWQLLDTNCPGWHTVQFVHRPALAPPQPDMYDPARHVPHARHTVFCVTTPPAWHAFSA